MEKLADFLSAAAGFVWGWPLIILLFGTHLFLTIRLGFIQRHIGRMIKLSFAKDRGGEGDVSHFGALTTALAATIGTGNIIGVATAITLGGPGAVFWMWLTGVLGIATKYGEALLSVKYRVTNERGQMSGGPMYVLERGMRMKWLGVIFAALTAIAAFGIGNMIQSNAVATQFEQIMLPAEQVREGVINTPRVVIGVILTLATGAVILGGIRSIARVCEFLVPIMAIGYAVGCVALIFMNFSALPGTVAVICRSAFSGEAVGGGMVGVALVAAMRFGVARGLFSNEAGLGSAPIVAAAARTANPVRQAMVSATATFWDTVVVCLLTGLVLVGSDYWRSGFVTGTVVTVEGDRVVLEVSADAPILEKQEFTLSRGEEALGTVALESAEQGVLVTHRSEGERPLAVGDVARGKLPAKELASRAFRDLPVLGTIILTFGLATFVFSTILGWSYYGEKAVEYLFGTVVILPYRILWVCAVMVGTLAPLHMIWDFADITNGLMAVPNLVSLLVLSGVIVAETRKYSAEFTGKAGD